MNKLTFLSLIFVVFATGAYAQTKTPSLSVTPEKASPTKTTTEKSIETLKEKIADKVDELRSNNTQLTAGLIVSIKKGSIEIITDDSKNLTVSVDESLTKVFDIVKNSKKEIKADDLEKGDYIIVSGPLVENTVNSNEVYRDLVFTVSSGQITEVDKENNTVDVITHDKEEMTLDIEKTTKQQIMDIKSLELAKTGISKYKTGDTIHFIAEKQDEKESSSQTALRILIIPQEYF